MAPEDLAKWIQDHGLSQGAFAERLRKAGRGLRTEQTRVSRWIRRKRLPNPAEQLAIQKLTGIPCSAWPAESSNWSE